MQIYLIRHGSTPGNLEHRYVGTTDEGLTAEAVQKLAQDKDLYPHPERLFASPMKRCLETAKLLFPEKKPEILDGLKECAFGEFEYKNYMELQDDLRYQTWIDSGGELPFPGGESRTQFASRCCSAFEQGCAASQRSGCRSAAFVVHGGTIMAVMERFAEPKKSYFEWQVKNGCGFAVRLNEETGALTDVRMLPENRGKI